MHLKFLSRGTGSAAVAAVYLLALKDASGKVRSAVEVLRGDPRLVAAIADGLPFKHRYTSGVMAWSPEDAPTQPEIERVIDEFEKTAWAGLAPDRYVWAAILHRDADGGVHVHLFAARCDLATGLSLNIAPPGWERTFDPLRDAFNYEHGWSRPDDPSRARPFRPAPHLAYQTRLARRAGEDVEPDVRDEIGMHLLELVAAGRVKDRAGVVAVLEERGYDVPRQGDHYVTARDPETGERWRLRGSLYERDFDRERFLREAPEPSAGRKRADGDDDPAAAAWKAGEKARRRRADYNRAYYGRGHRPGRDGVQATGVADEVERESGPAAGRSAGHDASLTAHLERELGDGAVAAVADAAEPARARRAAAGEGRGKRSLAAAADALADAALAAGPELSRALGEHVAVRERAVCAISIGGEWLADAQQEVLAEEDDRPLTVGERAHAVETVEGRLETDLSRREAEIAATSSGPVLLQEAFGGRSDTDAPLDFSARDRVLERVEQRVDEELRTQEEALRAIPPGRRYLSAAEQARAAGATGPPTLADRESMLRAATQQVGKELDRLEEDLLAIAGGEDLLAEVAGALAGVGRPRSLGERWEACEGATSGVEEELDRLEAAIRAAGEEFLRDARLAVLGSVECEAATLGERAHIVKAAAAAKGDAEKRWNEEKTARVEVLDRRPGGLDLYHAHLADLDPKWSLAEDTPPSREHDEAALAAAESDDTRLKRLRGVLSDEADAACYQEVLAQAVGQFKTSDLDNALTAGEKARAERETQHWKEKRDARVEELRALPGGMDLYHAHLADRDPKWDRKRHDKSSRANIDAALGAAESDAPRLERLHVVLSDEAAAIRYREDLGQVDGQYTTSDLDRALAAAEQAREHQAALRTATAATQAAAARSNITLHDAHVRVIYQTGETHATGLAAVDRTTEALALAADQELPSETIVDTWKANQSDPGGIAAALEGASSAQRVSRLERLFSVPGAGEAFITTLDEHDPSWRTGTHPRTINRALDIAERDLGRETRVPWHARVLNAAEQQFPGASSATWRRAGDDFTGAADTDRHGRSVSQALSDRARARALASEGPSAEPEPARDLVQQVTGLLRTEVEHRQLEARTGTARLAQRNRNSVWRVSAKVPPVPKPARLVPDATWEDAEPLWRTLTDLQERSERRRLAQRARHSATAVPEKTPPVPKPARLVPDATREDVVAAAPLIVRARLPEVEQQELRPASSSTSPRESWPETSGATSGGATPAASLRSCICARTATSSSMTPRAPSGSACSGQSSRWTSTKRPFSSSSTRQRNQARR